MTASIYISVTTMYLKGKQQVSEGRGAGAVVLLKVILTNFWNMWREKGCMSFKYVAAFAAVWMQKKGAENLAYLLFLNCIRIVFVNTIFCVGNGLHKIWTTTGITRLRIWERRALKRMRVGKGFGLGHIDSDSRT